jgi:hypothetical protein
MIKACSTLENFHQTYHQKTLNLDFDQNSWTTSFEVYPIFEK